MAESGDSGQVQAAREVVARLNDPQTGGRYERWIERARGCKRPVRLRGTSRDADAATGEVAREFSSEREPDAVLLTPCGNRRAHVCGACSEVYRGDAWQLVVSGLRGGKGVPESVAEHPLVFATFTAPSFGPVHTVREAGGRRLACRPRRGGEKCPHGRSLACTERHADDDPCLGEAICPDCYEYERCALWNHNAGRLFKRTRTYVERELARQAGITQKAARGRVRASYVKVAEFQRRGVVHFHTLWRLDAAGDELAAPPDGFDAELLVDAITAALPKVTVPAEVPDTEPYGWGRQHEVRALDVGHDLREAGRVAAYIAKYATKSTENAGGVGSRIEHERELRDLRCRDHAGRLVTGAWQAGAREEVDGERMRRWAHQFGFGGHCFTKSRRYSTTFKALREARAVHAAAQTTPAGQDAAKSDHNLIRHKGLALRRTWLSEGRGCAPRRFDGCKGPRAPLGGACTVRVGGADGGDGMNGGGRTMGRAPAPVRAVQGARVTSERYVSRRELAELMGVSIDCVDYFVRLGMPSETWGLRRRVFKPSAALAWAREHAERRAA